MRTVFKFPALCFMFLLLCACGASKKIVEPSSKSMALDELVAAKNFHFEPEWARPMSTQALNSVMQSGLMPPGSMISQINVIGNGNFFKMEGDSVSADLPYFGERQMGGGYDSNNGVKFDGLAEDLKIEKDENKQRYDITFNISEKAETYRCRLQLSPSQKGTLLINSSHRFTIRYEGKVSALEVDEVQ